MGERFFGRQCRLVIGDFGGKGDELGAGNVPLHIQFSVEKADTETSNNAKVTVWNLSAEHTARLDEKDCAIVLKAGYGSHVPLIFAGAAAKAVSTKEGADTRTEIEVVDSRVEMRDTYMSISYNGDVSTEQLYRSIAAEMGCAVQFSPSVEFKVLPNGYSFIGRARDALKRVTRADGMKWSMQNGILQIWKGSEPMSDMVYEISAQSGMIGSPKRVSSSGKSSDQKGTYTESSTADIGWEVSFLLNSAITVNDYVHLSSREVTGFFRVQKILIEGDNTEGSWQCTATLVEVKA